MLTTEDIKLLREFFATREEVATKEDIKEIKAGIDTLTMAVDSFTKEIKDSRTERVVMEHRVTKLEEDVKAVAKHTALAANL